MALVIQSNLARLRDLDARHRGIDPTEHDIRVCDVPQSVDFRDAVLDEATLEGYSPEELHLRLHEVWGQFCLMCWLFGLSRDAVRANLAKLGDGVEMHCDTALEAKHAEVHALSWRIAFEQRRRGDSEYVASERFAEDDAVAGYIPAIALGTPVNGASDGDLMLAACEHAGMLATLRWIMDARRVWGTPGLMELDDKPF